MTIIPSHLRIGHTERFYDGDAFSDNYLHFGEVQEVIYANDERSRSKQFTEYSVYVQYRDPQTKVGVGRIYENCCVSNVFGGFADKLDYTLRGENSSAQAKNDRLGLGSKVLLLCINGETQYPVIIGGIGDPTDKSQTEAKDKDLGHHFSFVFNGISFTVDKDGALSVVFGGPTTIDGKLDDNKVKKEATGTALKITKEGAFQVTTIDGSGNEELKLLLDHKNKKVILKQSDALEIGEATDHFILGDTYRNAESSMNQDLQTGLQNVAQKLTVAGTQLAAAGTSMVTPITGAVAAAPNIASAAAQILAAVADLNKMAASIAKMEAQAKKYLSKKNTTD